MNNGILIELHTDKEVAVPSFRRRAAVLDAPHVPEPVDEVAPPARAEALALAEEAEAEAVEAEAVAAAARARARAIRLRREAAAAGAATPNGAAPEPVSAEAEPADTADAPSTVGGDVTLADTDADADTTDTDAAHDATDTKTRPAPADAPRVRRSPKVLLRVAAGFAALLICAAVAASSYMVVHHRHAQAEQQRAAEFAAAARQGVVTLMSLNFKTAKDDVQRIIDNSTGDFKKDFESTAGDFTKVAEESKVITEATVNATGVKSMTDDSAVVLVAATSRITNAAGAKQDPRTWRLIVDVMRDGDRIKMSKVEFAP